MSTADPSGEVETLERFAFERWWADDVDAAIAARERAYVLRRERDEPLEAARVAGLLAWDYGAMRGVTAVANGWLQRARRLIAGLPPAAEQAWLALIEASFHIDTDAEAVLRLSREAGEHARLHHGLDVEMTAMTLEGLALVSLGRVDEGTRLLDEGAVAATSGELHDPIAIGSCCCNMIIACERTRDFDRAGQWCEQLDAFATRTGQRPLLALCRAHHGTVQLFRGDWGGAERDLTWAADELSTLRPPLGGYARGRLAQLRLRQGRAREARSLLAQGGPHVLTSVVRAELGLDEDDPSAVLSDAERYLQALGARETIESAAAFELLVPAHLRLGDAPAARRAHERLAGVADSVPTVPLLGSERLAAGRIARAGREHREARAALEEAVDRFTAAAMPYEAAQARLDVARVVAALQPGGAGTALEHAVAARSAFQALGADRAARTADAVVGDLGGRAAVPRGGGLTRRELQVLGLVAQGLSNRQIAERLVVSEHTVHRHVANIYGRMGVSSRAAAVSLAAESGLLGGKDGPNGR